jgi:hypothetical protein
MGFFDDNLLGGDEKEKKKGGFFDDDLLSTAATMVAPSVAIPARAAAPVIRSLQWFSAPQESMQRGAQAAYEDRPEDIPGEMWSGLKLEGGDTATWGESVLAEDSPVMQYNPLSMALRQLPSGEIGGVELDPDEMFRAALVGGAELFADPLAGVGQIAKIPAVVRGGAKVKDLAAGTKVGRALSINPSEHFWHAFNRFASQVGPEARQSERNAAEMLSNLRDEAIERHGDDLDFDELYEGLERPQSAEAQKFAHEAQKLEAVRQRSRILAQANDAIRKRLGMALRGLIGDDAFYRWQPRNLDIPETTRLGGLSRGNLSSGAVEAGKKRQRVLYKWVDDKGREVMRGGAAGEFTPGYNAEEAFQLTKLENIGQARALAQNLTQSMRNRVVKVLDDAGEEMFYHLDSGKEVFPKQLSKVEAQKLTNESTVFKADPYAAHAEDISRKISENSFLRFASQGLQDGWMRYADKVDELPEGWVRLEIPGMERFAAPKPLVGRIERLGKTMYSPESVFDALEKGAVAFAGSKAGQGLKAFRDKWASWQLGIFPRFHAGNAAGNAFLLYMAGLPAHDVARYIGRAAALQVSERAIAKGKTPVVKTMAGMSPDSFIRTMERYGAFTSWSESEKTQKLLGYSEQPGVMDLLDEQLNKLGSVGRAAQYGTEGLRRAGRAGDWATQKGFKFAGEPIENNARLAAALWWLDKHGKKGAKPTTEELKEAAYFAQQTLFDYSDLSSFERRFVKTAMPFYTFHRKMLGRAFNDILTKPHRLGRMERAGEYVFETPEEQQLYDAPPYLNSNAAVTGIRGVGSLGEGKEGPRVALLGRFNPYSILDQVVQDRGAYLWNLLQPLYKAAPEMALNEQVHTGFPIDQIVEETSGGAGQGLFGSLAGAPHDVPEELFGLHVPAYWKYAADILPTASMVREADRLAEGVGQAINYFSPGNRVGNFLQDETRSSIPAEQHVLRGATGISLYEPKWHKYREGGKYREDRAVASIRRREKRARKVAFEQGQPPVLAEKFKKMAEQYAEQTRRKRALNYQMNSTTP